ncbi:MAG TPA: hypothetical protein VG433_12055, partial [Pirellulales bacterium]|nr:hypothetical protein [Pirellulales bacterium]
MYTDFVINNTIADRLQRLTRIAAGLTIAAASIVLVGWIADVEMLRSLIPGRVPMNPLSAINFLVCGFELYALERHLFASDERRLGMIPALLVVLTGGICVAGYLFDFNPVIDRLLFRDRLGTNRMAPNTALAFVLSGGSLALLARREARSILAGQLLAIVAGGVALVAGLGYVYSV